VKHCGVTVVALNAAHSLADSQLWPSFAGDGDGICGCAAQPFDLQRLAWLARTFSGLLTFGFGGTAAVAARPRTTGGGSSLRLGIQLAGTASLASASALLGQRPIAFTASATAFG